MFLADGKMGNRLHGYDAGRTDERVWIVSFEIWTDFISQIDRYQDVSLERIAFFETYGPFARYEI